jgi:hypothetical protein
MGRLAFLIDHGEECWSIHSFRTETTDSVFWAGNGVSFDTIHDFVLLCFWTMSIVRNSKHSVSETGSEEWTRRETHTPLGPLERVNLNHWTSMYVLPISSELKRTQFLKRCFLEFRILGDGQTQENRVTLSVIHHFYNPLHILIHELYG